LTRELKKLGVDPEPFKGNREQIVNYLRQHSKT